MIRGVHGNTRGEHRVNYPDAMHKEKKVWQERTWRTMQLTGDLLDGGRISTGLFAGLHEKGSARGLRTAAETVTKRAARYARNAPEENAESPEQKRLLIHRPSLLCHLGRATHRGDAECLTRMNCANRYMG